MEKRAGLFEETPVVDGQVRRESGSGRPRIEEPQRGQGEMRFECPEDALEESHPARVIWDVLGEMDLCAFSVRCESVEGRFSSGEKRCRRPRIERTASGHPGVRRLCALPDVVL